MPAQHKTATIGSRIRSWKLACAGFAPVVFGVPVSQAAQSSADAQVEAVFGVPPWTFPAQPLQITKSGVEPIYVNCGVAQSSSPLTISALDTSLEGCINRDFQVGQLFRTDLGLDGTGSLPPSGKVFDTSALSGVASQTSAFRCILYSQSQTTTSSTYVCDLFELPAQPNPPIAQNQYIKTATGTPVSINLANGYVGAVPTSAALVGPDPIGGTVTGLPNTTVTFTPFSPSYEGVASFSYELSSASGVSNAATVYVTVAPNVISPQEQAELAQLGQWLANAAKVSGIASVGTDPKNYVLKQAVKTIGIEVSQQAFVDIVFKNHGIQGQKADLILDTAKFIESNANTTPSNPYSAILTVLSAAAKLGSLVANWKATDPPDSNYTVIAQPPQISLPSTGNPTIDEVIIDYLTFCSYTTASIHAAERYQGASIAGQPAWAAMQQNAYQQFSAEAATAHSLLAADNEKLIQALPAVDDLSGFPGGAAGLVAAYRAQCGQPLPAAQNLQLLSLVNQFQTLGAQATIDQTVCNYVDGITEADVNVNLHQLLSTPLP